jgi:hypothetical protein
LRELPGSWVRAFKAAARECQRRLNERIRGSEKKMSKPGSKPELAVEQVRLIADLRIMHAKVHELYEIVTVLKRGHEENAIRKYADHIMLEKDIQRVDEIYLWFLSLKEEGIRLRQK